MIESRHTHSFSTQDHIHNKLPRADCAVQDDGSSRGKTTPSFHHWKIEILCMLGSLVSVIVMTTVLYVVNNRPLQSLTLGINLNTIVALLAALSKGLFLVPVTEALGQWKWNWFYSRPRSVGWLLIYDSANRSVLGALDLILHAGLKHAASFGAVIYVASIIVSLTTQEVVVYRSELRPINARARIWSTENQHSADPKYTTAMIDKSVVQEILRYQDSYQQVPGSNIIYCPSVDCTFPPFESISVCMQSEDITSDLELNEISDLRHGSYNTVDGRPDIPLNSTTGANILIPSADLSFTLPIPIRSFYYLAPIARSAAFLQDSWAYKMGILNWILVQGYKLEGTSPGYLQPNASQMFNYVVTAVEVLLHACVKSYNISVSNGTNSFDSIASDIEFWQRDGSSKMEPRTGPLICTTSDTGDPICRNRRKTSSDNSTADVTSPDFPLEILSKTSGSQYSIGGDTLRSIAKSLYKHLGGWGFNEEGNKFQVSKEDSDSFASVRLGSIFDPLSDQGADVDRNISSPISLFQNITTSLNGLLMESIAVRHHDISGTAWVATTVIEVRWAWLSFLAAEILLAALFLAWTIIQTNKMGIRVWKNSTLATMMTLSEESRNAIADYMGADSRPADGHVHLRLVDDQLVDASNSPV